MFFVCLQIGIGQDTFSIVAVDPETREVGSAGASCVDGAAGIGGVQIISKLIPNKGGINGQAWICVSPHVNLDLGITEMMNGSSPSEILEYLYNNDGCFSQGFNPEFRQYGIVDFDENGDPRADAFTGNSADDYKGHIIGPNFAIQGNILLGPEVLEQMAAGFTETEGSLAEKLMAAMQGANIPGADERCLNRGTSSTSAFLMVSQPEDNFLEPSLFLNVAEMPFGMEPIDSLQVLFNQWLTTDTSNLPTEDEISIFPNPCNDKIHINASNFENINSIEIFNQLGKLVKKIELIQPAKSLFSINLSKLNQGLYFVQFKNNKKIIKSNKIFKY